MISFDHVSFAYEPDRPVLSDVSFSIGAGEAVGLIGANGAGKSTLLQLILGLLAPTAGQILVGGLPVTKENLREIRRKAGLLMQSSENQLFLPTVREDMAFGPRNYMVSAEETERRIDEVLARLDLAHLKDRYNHKLSGGERRMAAIAVVLCLEPEILLMDEPTITLDPKNRRRVITITQSLTQTRLIASHDLDMILDTCSRVILLADGTVAADGPADEVLRDRALLEAHGLELPLRLQG